MSTLNLLLKIYFIDELLRDKTSYNLNDISGFIDLFDGIFFELNGELEKKEYICPECNKKKKIKYIDEKIDFIINELEPNLKEFKYNIDREDKVSKILANFRNTIRHQKPFEKFDLNKIIEFSKGILKLYIVKHILNINKEDYNIIRILRDFKIYPLIEHKYQYLDNEITIYNTYTSETYLNKELTENNVYFSALKEYKEFENAKPEDFIYLENKSTKLKMIYIDDNDKIKRALLFFGIVVYNSKILQEKTPTYPLTLSYNELIENLEL